MRNTPAGFSHVHYALIEHLVPQYCVHHGLNAAPMSLSNQDEGVTVEVGPCSVSALVEFHAPPQAPPAGEYDPANWRVGWLQSVESGAVIYSYGGGNGPAVRAAVGPAALPCRDSDGAGPFYDQSMAGVKAFALPPRTAGEAALEDAMAHPLVPYPAHVQPFLTGPDIRFVTMEDRPGAGHLPLKLTCRQTADPRARVGQAYTLGWFDPLDPRHDAGTAKLQHIGGSLQFKTWLVMQFIPTKQFHALHLFEWEARYDLTIHGPLFTKGGASGSRLIRETALKAELPPNLTDGPTANQLACVKFLPPH